MVINSATPCHSAEHAAMPMDVGYSFTVTAASSWQQIYETEKETIALYKTLTYTEVDHS